MTCSDVPIRMLVDSGATHSFISAATLAKLSQSAYVSVESVPLDVQLADGSVV